MIKSDREAIQVLVESIHLAEEEEQFARLVDIACFLLNRNAPGCFPKFAEKAKSNPSQVLSALASVLTIYLEDTAPA